LAPEARLDGAPEGSVREGLGAATTAAATTATGSRLLRVQLQALELNLRGEVVGVALVGLVEDARSGLELGLLELGRLGEPLHVGVGGCRGAPEVVGVALSALCEVADGAIGGSGHVPLDGGADARGPHGALHGVADGRLPLGGEGLLGGAVRLGSLLAGLGLGLHQFCICHLR
jgi:hypothetical protein